MHDSTVVPINVFAECIIFVLIASQGFKNEWICGCISHFHVLSVYTQYELPGDGRDRVNKSHHEVKEQGALPFHKFFLKCSDEKKTNQLKEVALKSIHV